MAKLLLLVHRLPYPPNKGDKVRSFHLLRHLASKHEIYLGTFVDDSGDKQYVSELRTVCAEVCAIPLYPWLARVTSLAGLITGQALTYHYYRSHKLVRWVQQVVAEHQLLASIVFSSSMVPYACANSQLPMLVDFVDVDSVKWAEYATHHRWPLSWLYAREGTKLLEFERSSALRAQRSFFATEMEAELFRHLAPESAATVEGMSNGVDADYFAPDPARKSPFPVSERPIVFTGAMDYWPNVDAVSWFAREILPVLRKRHADVRLHIVGRSPTPKVLALACEAVVVTGTVPDVRPYIQYAAAVVAPLRLARGIQNKILEAMAMRQAVVAAASCVDALHVDRGSEVLSASSASDYIDAVGILLSNPERARAIGEAARARVLRSYSWEAHLQRLDCALSRVVADAPASALGAHA